MLWPGVWIVCAGLRRTILLHGHKRQEVGYKVTHTVKVDLSQPNSRIIVEILPYTETCLAILRAYTCKACMYI
ncbi:hypothetical protein ACRRTK_011727 [Alexandromys fortis]